MEKGRFVGAVTAVLLTAACGAGSGTDSTAVTTTVAVATTTSATTTTTSAAATTTTNTASPPTTEPPPTTTRPAAAGPEVVFERTFGGDAMDRGVGVIETSDGGFAVTGVTASTGAGGDDALLLRLDPDGEEMWSRTYGGPSDDAGWAVLETPDGGFVVAGFTRSYGAGGQDVLMVRTDADGGELWTRTYGGERDEYGWSITPVAGGGYVIAGETASVGAGGKDAYLVRVDEDGQELWSQTYGGDRDDRSFAVRQATDGGFVLAGITLSAGAGGRDAHVVKTNAAGAVEWETTFGDTRDDVAHSIDLAADGGYIVYGYTDGFDAAGYDARVVELDAGGDERSVLTLGGPGEDRIISGAATAGGGSVLVGYTTSEGAGSRDAYLVVVDDSEVQWSRTFGGRSEDIGYGVVTTSDGGFVMTGHVSAGGASSRDVLVVRIAPG